MTPPAQAPFGGALQGLSAALQRQWWIKPPTLTAQALRLLAGLYAQLAGLHRRLSRPKRVGVPVVVVGNLIVGGAGKTPTTIAVVRLLRAFGWHPGVVSRGHGRKGSGLVQVSRDSRASDCGDEPLLIRLRTGMPVMVGSDRVAAVRALRAAHPQIDIIVADDGLQHHRLARDLEVIVFDERGAGNGLLLPAGPLREALPDQAAPTTLVLYNAPCVTTHLPGWMASRRVAGALLLSQWWQGQSAAAGSLQALRGVPLTAAAGMANPQRFFEMLREQGLTLSRTLALPDHHAFDALPWPADTADVIITEKDAVKLRPDAMPRSGDVTRIWVAPLDFEPEVAFAAALKRHYPYPPKH
ncbi:MAG: tetraacyldisaccharide 4'-kinase [Pseudomonadota bacterium]